MTRENAKANLIAIGIAEPTDEQITNYLNQIGGETKREKDLAGKYKGDALKVKELQEQLEELANKNLSEVDLAKKETEKATTRVADLEKQIAIMQRKNALAEKGIVGEQADKLFREDGSFDFDVFGQILSERVESAKSQKEKELLEKTPNPKGSNKGTPEMTEVEQMASAVGKEIATSNQATADILKNYI